MKGLTVYGPQGCGKTLNKETIMHFFGLKRAVEDGVLPVLRALDASNRPMSNYGIRGWIFSHMKMYLTDGEFQANVRVLLRTNKITVDRTNGNFSLVK
jgi:hypothetical protein